MLPGMPVQVAVALDDVVADQAFLRIEHVEEASVARHRHVRRAGGRVGDGGVELGQGAAEADHEGRDGVAGGVGGVGDAAARAWRRSSRRRSRRWSWRRSWSAPSEVRADLVRSHGARHAGRLPLTSETIS